MGFVIGTLDGITPTGRYTNEPGLAGPDGEFSTMSQEQSRQMGLTHLPTLVLPTGFEPAIFAVRGRCPEPLDDGSTRESS